MLGCRFAMATVAAATAATTASPAKRARFICETLPPNRSWVFELVEASDGLEDDDRQILEWDERSIARAPSSDVETFVAWIHERHAA